MPSYHQSAIVTFQVLLLNQGSEFPYLQVAAGGVSMSTISSSQFTSINQGCLGSSVKSYNYTYAISASGSPFNTITLQLYSASMTNSYFLVGQIGIWG